MVGVDVGELDVYQQQNLSRNTNTVSNTVSVASLYSHLSEMQSNAAPKNSLLTLENYSNKYLHFHWLKTMRARSDERRVTSTVTSTVTRVQPVGIR